MVVRAVLGFGSGLAAIVAQATFNSTIGLGSVIVAMLVVILFGLFSFRDRRHSGWKDLYEQERERKENLLEEKEAERVIRHAIKDDLAATKAMLEIERAKPDLAVILEQQRILWSEGLAPLTETLQAMQKTQERMLDLLNERKMA